MKKLYLLQKLKLSCFFLLLLSGFVLSTKAQVSVYGFSQSAGTYVPITGGTVLGSTTTDDERFVDPALPLGGTTLTGVGFPIGFNFTYSGNVFDRIAVNANGWVSLGKTSLAPNCVNNASTSAYTPISSVAAIAPPELRCRIAGIGRDIQAQAGAEIRIQTIGVAPNQVCVIQWTNYKKFGTGGTGDNLNFQIRLNETTNAVDVVYGTIVFNATTNTADVGLGGSAATDFNNRTTTTNWNTTTAGPLNTSRCTMLNTVTVPVSGTTFTWTPPVPCAGAPNPGNTIASANPACSGVGFVLSLQNNPPVSGLTYQWQSSPDAVTWTNIAAATGITYSVSQTVATWYRCNVTCSGVTTASTPLLIGMASPTSCYCIPPTTNCNLDDEILNVTVAGINNNSLCGTNGYTNYSATISGTVIAGVTYPMTVSVGPGGTEYVGVWIDYNQNGIFEASEFTALGSGNGVVIAGNITIPATASLGVTRMRVRVRFNTALTGADACLAYTFGETEDYGITINPCIPVAITTQPTDKTISCGNNATFTVATTGSAPIYKWQEKTSAAAFWTDLTNTGVYSGVTTNALTITGAPVTMNGYKYRLLYSGPCKAIDSSNVVTLTVTQLIATVNPASANICNGSIQQLTITNITSPLPNTTSVCSGPLTLAIPDNNVAGVNHTLNVAGVPASAVITGLSVTINMTHTWAGDIVFALKAPNGQVFNLDYYLTGTGGGAATTGFTNTVISSTGITALSAATNPYTGTFKADAAAPGANPQSGPTGFIPTTTSWAALYTTGASVNGGWTLAMYDGGALDVGTLTSWCINVNYLAGIPATGAWTSSGGATLFTDPAATIPYVTGTQLNTVYVHPTTTTTYSVVVTTPVCVSAVTNIPVTVSNPVGAITAPANAAVCENGNTSFTVSAASGNAIVYQWQVSTDAGATWTNISDNSVYSGTGTATLTLTSVPLANNNYRYRAVLSVAACASTANSGSATLTVNPLPTITLSANPIELSPGMTTVITPSVTPNAGATYQWLKNGVVIPGATGSTITVDVDGLGDYTVAVVDVNGCSGVSSPITISAGRSETLFIYPSPNTGQFQVRYLSPAGSVLPRTLTIYDSKGARVYSKTFIISVPYGRMDVVMKNHGKGVYRVELGDHNGKRIIAGNVLVL